AWDCSGDLPGVARLIAGKRGEVRTCYERRLKVNNILAGSLRLQIKVGTGGKVAATKVSGSLRDNEVFSCVRKKVQSWSFPDPVGDKCAVLDVPFSFSPKN
ncbi:MAG: AgmX/PglI C-terminal domain-containing protein, partial [Myxococcales bacterium]|nr:AgmX/PglI C-terminal domain-containing protein [Myxococcales bacterium]